jgi:hypothetical protein
MLLGLLNRNVRVHAHPDACSKAAPGCEYKPRLVFGLERRPALTRDRYLLLDVLVEETCRPLPHVFRDEVLAAPVPETPVVALDLLRGKGAATACILVG